MVAETGKYDVFRHKKKNYGYQHQHGNKGRENCYQPLKGYLQSVPGFSPACNQRDNQGKSGYDIYILNLLILYQLLWDYFSTNIFLFCFFFDEIKTFFLFFISKHLAQHGPVAAALGFKLQDRMVNAELMKK